MYVSLSCIMLARAALPVFCFWLALPALSCAATFSFLAISILYPSIPPRTTDGWPEGHERWQNRVLCSSSRRRCKGEAAQQLRRQHATHKCVLVNGGVFVNARNPGQPGTLPCTKLLSSNLSPGSQPEQQRGPPQHSRVPPRPQHSCAAAAPSSRVSQRQAALARRRRPARRATPWLVAMTTRTPARAPATT